MEILLLPLHRSVDVGSSGLEASSEALRRHSSFHRRQKGEICEEESRVKRLGNQQETHGQIQRVGREEEEQVQEEGVSFEGGTLEGRFRGVLRVGRNRVAVVRGIANLFNETCLENDEETCL